MSISEPIHIEHYKVVGSWHEIPYWRVNPRFVVPIVELDVIFANPGLFMNLTQVSQNVVPADMLVLDERISEPSQWYSSDQEQMSRMDELARYVTEELTKLTEEEIERPVDFSILD